ncbi:hypothetical protein [Micromonospora sp. DT233]|uniref:hypothetical protein n=1 Tax=Micromonospora sp. DT233 TaxID=3393432 RepID=UPI003CEF79A3
MSQSAGPSVGQESHRPLTPGLEVFSLGWPDQAPDTVCGWGSSEPHTQLVRKGLTDILQTYGVRTLTDAGCGDLAWMSTLDLSGVDYVGHDVHERESWPGLRRRGYQLQVLDITTEDVRPSDLLICRDVFIHLPNDMVLAALARFRASCRLLLTTSYTSDPTLPGGGFSNLERMAAPSLRHAKLDLTLAPFGLGEPLERIPEDCPNKYLCLWDLSAVPSGGTVR